MLLKYSQTQKRSKLSSSGKPQRVAGMKLTSNVSMMPRGHRKMMKNTTSRKLNSTHYRAGIGTKREPKNSTAPVDACENSNDSGLGFDHHSDYPILQRQRPSFRFPHQEKSWCSEDVSRTKKHRMDFKVESDEDANDYFPFCEQQKTQEIHNFPRCLSYRRFGEDAQPPLTSQFKSCSSDGRVFLEILCEPETQHRARYQTEGSRGAVKDRTGTSFPVVRLNGYNKPALLQVFIGSDEGDVAPHMFYQACRVAGKNSTPSMETVIDRTVVIEMDIHPVHNMITVCDCVGILKERNVDVEHRFPEGSPPSKSSRKKSTSVRMVFRTTIRLPNGSYETLQVSSDTIACTQPQGVPEVSLMSWTSSPATGGVDLFVIGKNFVKDTKVIFYEEEDEKAWKVSVQPNKDFLHQSHLVCRVPPYARTNIASPVQVRMVVESCGKSSEAQTFTYTPVLGFLPPNAVMQSPAVPEMAVIEARNANSNFQQNQRREFHPVMLWNYQFLDPQSAASSTDQGLKMMDQPSISSTKCVCHKECLQMQTMAMKSVIQGEPCQQVANKQCKELPTPKLSGAGIVAELSATQTPSLATIRQFVSNQTNEHPLPSINVEYYLSRLENPIPSTFAPKQEQSLGNENSLEMNVASAAPAPIDLSNQIVSSMAQTVQNVIESQPSFDQKPSITAIDSAIAPRKRRISNDNDNGVGMKVSCLNFPEQTSENMLVAPSNGVTSLLSPSQCIDEILKSRRSISSELAQPLADLVDSPLTSNESTRKLDDLVNSAAESHMSSSSSLPSTTTSPSLSLTSSPPSSSSDMTSTISPEKSSSLISPAQTRMSPSTSPLNLLASPLEELSSAHQIQQMMPQMQTSNPVLLSDPMGALVIPNVQLPSPTEKAFTSSPQTNLLLQNLLPESKDDLKDGQLNLIREIEINRISGTECSLDTNLQSRVATDGPVVFGTVPASNLSQGEAQQASMTLVPVTLPGTCENIVPIPVTEMAQRIPLLTMPSTEPNDSALPLSNVQDDVIAKRPENGSTLTGGIQELTQMSEKDLLSYINPSCFDQV